MKSLCLDLISRLRKHVDSVDPGASLRAVHMGLQLHDAYPSEQKININVDRTFIDFSVINNFPLKTDVIDVEPTKKDEGE